MNDKSQYFYNRQIQRWILSFNNIFTDIYVDTGLVDDNNDKKLQRCALINLNAEQSVLSLLAKGSQNEMIQLPMIGTRYQGLEMDFENAHGTNVTYRRVWESAKTNKKVVEYKIMPRPYIMKVQVEIWTSDEDHMYSLLEQILVLFDPTLQLHTSDKFNDWGRITTVKLSNIDNTYVNSISEDQNAFSTTLDFEVNIWLGMPNIIKNNIIKQININLGKPHPLLKIDANGKVVPYVIPDDADDGATYADNPDKRPIIIE